MSALAHSLLGFSEQISQARIRETLALERKQLFFVQILQTQLRYVQLILDQVFDLRQEPGIDTRQLSHGIN